MSFLANFTGIPSQCYKEVKPKKSAYRLERQRTKWPLFTDHMVICIEVIKNLQKSEVNRVTFIQGHMIQNHFFSISNRELKVKRKGTTLFKVLS